jgi:hypothetical protein
MTVSDDDKLTLLQARKLWMPKHREMPEQCVSCPFREGNDAEFQKVLDKLVQSNGGGVADVDRARFLIRKDAARHGDFICHQSVYDENMDLRDKEHYRQCPGASAHYKSGKR